jgi:hypothetical protein
MQMKIFPPKGLLYIDKNLPDLNLRVLGVEFAPRGQNPNFRKNHLNFFSKIKFSHSLIFVALDEVLSIGEIKTGVIELISEILGG